MNRKYRLEPDALTSPCKLDFMDFQATDTLEPLNEIIGQERAVEALSFGLRMKKKGYNIFVAGLSGTGRSSYSYSITKKLAEEQEVPDDWVYVYNFKNPDKPKALSMEAGLGAQFKKDMEDLINDLQREISNIFEGSEYEAEKNQLYRSFQQENDKVVQLIDKIASKYGFVVKESEGGLVTVPLKGDQPMTKEEYGQLSAEEVEELRENSSQLTLETLQYFNQMKTLEAEFRNQLKKLEESKGYRIINFYITKLLQRYGHRKLMVEYINHLEQDILEHLDYFKKQDEVPEANVNRLLMMQGKMQEDFLNRYGVNLFIDNRELTHAPIIIESNPSLYNLLGSIEYKNEMGVLKTDFMEIKPGALHLSNGGYLVLNIHEVLLQQHAWETLKRALKTGEVNIESINKLMGYVVTSTLKPEAIPLNIKIVLIGDHQTYHALYNLDEDFRKLFKVMADFDVEMSKDKENVMKMAQFIAAHCEKENLKPFDFSAVARVMEYSSRLADHKDKLSAQFNQIVEILYEADAWRDINGGEIVLKKHVEKAIQQKIYRNSKYEEKLNEMIKDGSLLMDCRGKQIGQINGLVVMGTGEHSFGKPSRITVSTYRGKAGIINIEREVKKSGSIHDKGVLILSGYLGYKYAQQEPLSLAVSISFEQNYSMIDGDSASSTELYAILSSIAEVPIKQSIAVTGSVNQKGEIQPIGGVNEKIEGFFDVCSLEGLTGNQGVVIPIQNVKNLMLRQDVIEAVRNNHFHIYAISHVEEGIEILTDVPAGELLDTGVYPEGTINYLITEKLKGLSKKNQNK
ncbi:Lon protease family protein [Alkaliphilus hydrothermalis]|uniref:endopeptidase La n=1 Tax=Alkaliphilus hydrothermalis TaxID=1482730 RepID=A0ABS2NMS7_9FIRM|nr:ATP-binding protein [Alkaliphilus hydrothermalis]MBM7614249.1 lon-related putative ATP-dependent protease [Alkaliphilus hydrothermalis]